MSAVLGPSLAAAAAVFSCWNARNPSHPGAGPADGHCITGAGPESPSNLDTLVEPANRCDEPAAELPDQGVVGSDRLVASLATTKELGNGRRSVLDRSRCPW